MPIADIDVLENTACRALVAGANDRVLRAYDANSGTEIWRFDTAIGVKGVNGCSGRGVSISRGGTAIVNGMFYQSSGYGQGMGMPGNLLFAFEVPPDRIAP